MFHLADCSFVTSISQLFKLCIKGLRLSKRMMFVRNGLFISLNAHRCCAITFAIWDPFLTCESMWTVFILQNLMRNLMYITKFNYLPEKVVVAASISCASIACSCWVSFCQLVLCFVLMHSLEQFPCLCLLWSHYQSPLDCVLLMVVLHWLCNDFLPFVGIHPFIVVLS